MELIRLATIRLSAPPPRAVGVGPYIAANGLLVRVENVDGLAEFEEESGADGGATLIWPYEHDKVRVAVSGQRQPASAMPWHYGPLCPDLAVSTSC